MTGEHLGCRYKVRLLMRPDGTQGYGFYAEGRDGNRPVVIAHYDVGDLAINETLARHAAISAIEAWVDGKKPR